MVVIEQLKHADEATLKDILVLITQLRRNPAEHRGQPADLTDIVSNKNAILVVAKDGARIVGMGTLYIISKVGKRVATIEDVVVDESQRGKGLGQSLMQALIDGAKERNVDEVYLTSNPKREAANALYQKMGFELVATNPYKLKLK